MGELIAIQTGRELRKLVSEASHALARLDTRRLEELALSCQELNRDLTTMAPDQRQQLATEAREASADMAVFARVLEATRANIKVIERLRELRTQRLEYRLDPSVAYRGVPGTEASRGDN